MTQDEIIRMAREAGIGGISEYYGFVPFSTFGTKELERFAALVAAHEREKWEQALPIAMDAMMLQEREACAKVCEELGNEYALELDRNNCAAVIRARGEK